MLFDTKCTIQPQQEPHAGREPVLNQNQVISLQLKVQEHIIFCFSEDQFTKGIEFTVIDPPDIV